MMPESMAESTASPPVAIRVLDLLQESLGRSLQALYLHGSAVGDGLGPHSDVDLLAVVDRPLETSIRRALLEGLMRTSGSPSLAGSSRPVELTVFLTTDLHPAAFPARSEFMYGEWLRSEFLNGRLPEPVSDPELTLLLAQARQVGRTLFGPPAAALLAEIPHSQVSKAMRDVLPVLTHSLEGDERNVLLTLARIWRTFCHEDFVSKSFAGRWACARIPEEPGKVLELALNEHEGRCPRVDWKRYREEARGLVQILEDRIQAQYRP